MVVMILIKTYLELSRLKTFDERFEYLNLSGLVGDTTFGSKRYLNQMLYQTAEWKRIRDKVIIRDNGCDLGIAGREIEGQYILVHHINPITIDDILNRSSNVFDLNNLICCTKRTHNAIHYGDKKILLKEPITRRPGDTCLW